MKYICFPETKEQAKKYCSSKSLKNIRIDLKEIRKIPVDMDASKSFTELPSNLNSGEKLDEGMFPYNRI